MRWIVVIAVLEVAATGLILIASPALFGWLIFDAEFAEPGQALGRLTGIALIGFALASWPAPAATSQPAVRALAIYNTLATIYLVYVGVSGRLVGILLWPAIVLHAILSIVLARAWYLWKQDHRGRG